MPAIDTYKGTVGDTLLPLNAIIRHSGGPVDISADTVKFLMKSDDLSTTIVAATATGITKQPTQAFTANITLSTTLIFCNSHGVAEGQQVILTTSNALPGGLAISTRYFVVQVTEDSFGLARFPQGTPITLTDNGTGTQTFAVVGSVQYDFQTADVATPGNYRAWFQRVSGGETQTYPKGDEYIAVVLT